VRLALRLDALAERRWFLPVVGVFPLADYAAPVLPNQLLLGGLSALRPERWRVLAATFLGAAVVGAIVVASVAGAAGPSVLDALADLDGVDEAVRWVERHGLWALLGLALLPWPPRTAVVACALVGFSPVAIGAVVLAGRSVPVVATAALAARAPAVLRRFPSLDRVLTAVATARDARTSATSSRG
jgi:membrane protein YqaA with SNARE-associated domain